MDREEYIKIVADATREGFDELDELVYKTTLVSRAMQFLPGMDADKVDEHLDKMAQKYSYVENLSRDEISKELDKAYGGERNVYGRSDPRLP